MVRKIDRFINNHLKEIVIVVFFLINLYVAFQVIQYRVKVIEEQHVRIEHKLDTITNKLLK